MAETPISPYGGELVDPMASGEEVVGLTEASRDWPSWSLGERQLCDLELLLNGGFSPLASFMGRADYESVLASMRLSAGTLWPIPITLDLPKALADTLSSGDWLALRDGEGVMLAALEVEEVWEPDLETEALTVYGTSSLEHPGVAAQGKSESHYVAGALRGLRLPVHYDFQELRRTASELRGVFKKMGWRRVVAFQTRNPMHRAHQELTLRAAKETEANLLINPVVGMTKPGDVDYFTRVRAYQAILPRYPRNTVELSLLPLAMRLAGPREAVWHAIIRRNYGCTHLIVGRDHAGPGSDSSGKAFYGPYDAQELLSKHEDEVGVTMVPFRQMVYVEDLDTYLPDDEVPEGSRALNISGTELRERLADGREIPEWFSFPEVVAELRRTHPARHRQGFTVFFTGLSGAGKSTVANALAVKLLEMGGRPVTLLDGDVVRKHLSSELGFSKEHRDINIRRIGFVASEITRNGGIAICAPIAPYEAVRNEVAGEISAVGGFVLVYVNTPLDVCESRDRKGLYAKARAGLIAEFTGISDPYEEPANPGVVIDTRTMSAEEAAQEILLYLEREGFVGVDHRS